MRKFMGLVIFGGFFLFVAIITLSVSPSLSRFHVAGATESITDNSDYRFEIIEQFSSHSRDKNKSHGVVVDKETGVHYFFHWDSKGDMVIMTPVYDAEGKIVVGKDN